MKKWSKAEREEDNPGIKTIQLDEKFYAQPVQMSQRAVAKRIRAAAGKNQKWRTVKMKTKNKPKNKNSNTLLVIKSFITVQEWTEKDLSSNGDDTDNVAPYRINGMNIRESDIVEKSGKATWQTCCQKACRRKIGGRSQCRV